MLTEQQKEDLYTVLTRVLGPDLAFESAKKDFNEQTVDAVEQAIDANIKCNRNMKELLTGLMQGSSALAKGWLKRSLKLLAKRLKEDHIQLNGYGCYVGTRSRWRTAIILTTT